MTPAELMAADPAVADPGVAAPAFARADSEASAVHRDFGVFRPDDIDLEDICFGHGIRVHEAEIGGAAAWLLRNGDKGVIRVSSRLRYDGQKRFAIAHELGHWKLHRDLRQSWLCSKADIFDYRRSTVEIEANRFASSLLLPSRLVHAWAKEPFSFEGILARVQQLTIGPIVLTRRMIEHTAADCMLVAHDAGICHYYQSGPNCRMPRIRPKEAVPTMELVAGTYRERLVPRRTWFPGEDGELIEHSYRIPGEERTLTVLVAG